MGGRRKRDADKCVYEVAFIAKAGSFFSAFA